MLVKYEFKPGINREGTQFTAGTGWYDADKIRFRKGRAEQIGGWQKYSNNTFLGICRSLHDWVAAASTQYLGIGTNLKFYINQEMPIMTLPLSERLRQQGTLLLQQ